MGDREREERELNCGHLAITLQKVCVWPHTRTLIRGVCTTVEMGEKGDTQEQIILVCRLNCGIQC